MSDDLSRALDRFADLVGSIENAPIAPTAAKALADVWVLRATGQVGVDTGQTKRRTRIVDVVGSNASAVAVLESDTPYAGFHNYGSWRTPPNRYWSDGMTEAEQAVSRIGGQIGSEIGRVLASGGVWNPRRIG